MRMLSVVDVFACCFVVVIVATARKEQNMCVRTDGSRVQKPSAAARERVQPRFSH